MKDNMNNMLKLGTEWYGVIPQDWQVKKAKYLFKERNQKGNEVNVELLSPSQKYGVIPQSLFRKLTGSNPVQMDINKDLSQLKTIHKGDFCISLSAYMGGIEYSQYEGVISPAYHAFYKINNNIYNPYYKFLFKSATFINEIERVTPQSVRVGRNTSFEAFGNLLLPIPDISEQKKIAEYLDKVSVEIESLNKTIQSQIEILLKYKNAIITEYVTKGIYKNVSMKDSEIPWIGIIPSHWKKYRIADLYEDRNERGNAELPILTVSINTGVSDRELADEEKDRAFQRSEDRTKYKRVYPGDITYNMMRAWQGGFGAVRVNGMVSPAYVVAKPKGNIQVDNRFLEALFRCPMGIEEVNRYSYGIMDFRKRLYWPQFRNIKVALPDIDEQKEIADCIDQKSHEIDGIIKQKEEQIAILTDYKKSLIYEYVTGKKVVPV